MYIGIVKILLNLRIYCLFVYYKSNGTQRAHLPKHLMLLLLLFVRNLHINKLLLHCFTLKTKAIKKKGMLYVKLCFTILEKTILYVCKKQFNCLKLTKLSILSIGTNKMYSLIQLNTGLNKLKYFS